MNKVKQTKRAYQQVDLWKRKELIDCVNRKQETMKECAKRLQINYCTAKHIMKVFRRSGSYETDLMRKKKQKEQALRQRVLNDSQFAQYTQAEVPKIRIDESGHDSTCHNTDEQAQESLSNSSRCYNRNWANQYAGPQLFVPVETVMMNNINLDNY